MTYGDGLLTVTPEGITIDTGLSAREAGTAKLSQHQTEQGVIISVSADGTVSYSPWNWTGSHEDVAPGRKNYSVFVDGEAFEGKPLLTLLDEADSAFSSGDKTAFQAAREKTAAAINSLSAAVEDAAGKDTYLPDNGPLGTLIADDGRILLLPENVFQRAVQSRSDRDASKFAGCWKNTSLSGIDGWRFTLACYAYRYISGKSPFPQDDSEIRAADYFDRNFVPLEWFCTLKGTDSTLETADLYSAIFADLSKAAPVQETAKQKKKKASRRAGIEESKSVPVPELPAYESREFARYTLSGEYIRQQKQLKRTRFIRRNNLAIKWCSIGAIVVLFLGFTFIRDKLAAPTTDGMEPLEVLTMFYDAFDQLDPTHFDAAHTDSCASSLSNYLSTMYVTSKMRQSYEGMGSYTMNQWLNLNTLTGSYIFGLTNLTFEPLGNTPPEYDSADPADEFTWKVHYYIVYNMGNDDFSYIDQTDIVTISNIKSRWMISGLETVEAESYESVAPELTMKAVSLQQEAQTSDQGTYLLSLLKDDYFWLPTAEEVEKGKQQLLDGWNATEFQKVVTGMGL